MVDPSRLSEWVTIHDSLQDASDRPLERGSELTQVLRIAGRTIPVRWTVVENEPCKRVVWQGRGLLGSHARVVYRFDSDDEGRETTFSYINEYELPGGPLGRIAGLAVSRVAQKKLDDSLQRRIDVPRGVRCLRCAASRCRWRSVRSPIGLSSLIR